MGATRIEKTKRKKWLMQTYLKTRWKSTKSRKQTSLVSRWSTFNIEGKLLRNVRIKNMSNFRKWKFKNIELKINKKIEELWRSCKNVLR